MQKLLTKEDFAESAFLAGNGTDLQPLLRLNHLLKPLPIPGKKGIVAVTFVSATAGEPLNLANLKAAIKDKLATLAAIEPGCLEIVGEPRELKENDLDAGAIRNPDDWFTSLEREAYIDQLVRPFAHKAWAAEVIFERGKGTGRFIRFIHIGGEAMATLDALSHGGLFVPKVIATVQTGPLEDPQGPLARMLSRFANKPQVWIRGRWEHFHYSVRNFEFHHLSGGEYSHIVQKFPYWNGSLGHSDAMPASYERDQAHSVVRAFQMAPVSGLQDKVELTNGSCTIRLIKQTLEPNGDERTRVVSKVVKDRWIKAGLDASRVVIWEDLAGANHRHRIQPFTLHSALNSLATNPLEKKHYAILPVGFEDEGFRVREFLLLGKNVEIDIYFEDELEFADLRKYQD